jgi:hypothetical protein
MGASDIGEEDIMNLGTVIIFAAAAVIVVSVFAMLISLRVRAARAARRSRAERQTAPQTEPERSAPSANGSVVWASAVVSDSQPDPSDFGAERVRTALTLRVMPPDGAAFQALAVWLVDADALHLVTPDSHIAVSLNGDDEKSVCPAVPWASVPKWYQK